MEVRLLLDCLLLLQVLWPAIILHMSIAITIIVVVVVVVIIIIIIIIITIISGSWPAGEEHDSSTNTEMTRSAW